jgi:uncharacterized protein YxeA
MADETTNKFLEFLKNIPSNVSSMSTWKKTLIIVVIVIAIFVGAGFLIYFKGYHDGLAQCKSTKPPVMEEAKTPPEKTKYNKKVKNPKACGEKNVISASFEKVKGKDKIKVVSKNNCLETVKYFDYTLTCPVAKNLLQFAPGLYMMYANDSKKFYLAPGGAVSYSHLWGSFRLGGELQGWGAINKDLYGMAVNAVFSYKW